MIKYLNLISSHGPTWSGLHGSGRACIASFERFLRTKSRTCPLCRKADYEKIVTTSGTRACMAVSAVKVRNP